jgi:hypothetical protein
VIAFAAGGACAYPLRAQVPVPITPPPNTATPAQPIIAEYRTPAIALVQPPNGGTVSQDRAALVFRFAQGEPDDPLDVTSFAVSVDGEDRTKEFQLAVSATGHQAWGTLGGAEVARRPSVGTHQVTARICSSRGACAVAQGSVVVLPAIVAPAPDETAKPISRKKKVLGALLDLGKKVLQVPL